jgi:hypothetical protein
MSVVISVLNAGTRSLLENQNFLSYHWPHNKKVDLNMKNIILVILILLCMPLLVYKVIQFIAEIQSLMVGSYQLNIMGNVSLNKIPTYTIICHWTEMIWDCH